jgi:hypothetical protein
MLGRQIVPSGAGNAWRSLVSSAGATRAASTCPPTKPMLIHRGAETPPGEQMPILSVFVRDGDQFRRTRASELMYAR